MKRFSLSLLLFGAVLFGASAQNLVAPAEASAGFFDNLFNPPSPSWGTSEQLASAAAPGSAAVALDAYGDGFAAWHDAADVWIRPYSADAGWGNPLRLERPSTAEYSDIISKVQITMNPNGDAIVAWLGRWPDPREENPDTTKWGTIWVSHHQHGAGWSIPEQILYEPEYEELEAFYVQEVDQFDIEISANGDAMLAWAQGSGRLVTSRYSAAEGTWLPSQDVGYIGGVGSGTYGKARPRLAMDSRGNTLLAWQECRGDIYDWHQCAAVYALRHSPAQGWHYPWIGDVKVADISYPLPPLDADRWPDTDPHPGAGVEVALLPTGQGVIAWRQYSADGNTDSIRVATEGLLSWNPAVDVSDTSALLGVITTKTIDVGAPRIGVDALGHVTVVWAQGPKPNSTGGQVPWEIWSNRLGALGWGLPKKIGASTPATGDEDAPELELSVNPDGEAVALWQRHHGSGDYSIEANHYRNGKWNGAQSVSAGPNQAFSPAVAIDAEGNAIGLWCEPANVLSNRFE